MNTLTRLITPIVFLTFFISCAAKYEEILIRESSKANISDDTEETLQKTSKLEGEYFTIVLQSVDNGSYYIASRPLKKPYPQFESIVIVDAQDEILHFDSNDEFLNFMAKGGYEMNTQEELRFGWNYTFKKKL